MSQSSVQNFGQRGVFISFSRNFGQDLKLRPLQPEDQPQSTPQPPPGGAAH
jgi:hypothetical protein